MIEWEHIKNTKFKQLHYITQTRVLDDSVAVGKYKDEYFVKFFYTPTGITFCKLKPLLCVIIAALSGCPVPKLESILIISDDNKSIISTQESTPSIEDDHGELYLRIAPLEYSRYGITVTMESLPKLLEALRKYET